MPRHFMDAPAAVIASLAIIINADGLYIFRLSDFDAARLPLCRYGDGSPRRHDCNMAGQAALDSEYVGFG